MIKNFTIGLLLAVSLIIVGTSCGKDDELKVNPIDFVCKDRSVYDQKYTMLVVTENAVKHSDLPEAQTEASGISGASAIKVWTISAASEGSSRNRQLY